MTDRRLSQAIAEGDGISVLVEIGSGDAARRAEQRGAEGVVVRGTHASLGREVALPLLAYGPAPEGAAESAAAALPALIAFWWEPSIARRGGNIPSTTAAAVGG